ncbi:hypothetical protein IWQ62_006032 [Dispira parvispora]|uniref:Acyl-CoA oxidase C-terminal domain-containing protein n=1 Tax=Dispira parvispora TaxID=1520584 RepID=A0A9W8ANT6_9FUNG|nr:hypothetical protein IWQ62_006032 [Dispira parvispora]
MGGHGYSSFSGLGDFYLDSLPNVTWEGDNYILSQQVARYLLKTARSLAGNSTLPSAGVATTITAQYLGEYLRMVRANVNKQPLLPLGSPSELEDLNKLVSVFGRRSAYLVWRLLDRMDNHHQTWNDSLVAMCAISRAHSQYIVLFNFVKACQQLQSTATTPQQHAMSTVLESLCCLFAVHTMERYLADFLEAGLVTAEQAPWIRQATLIQLTTVRQDAITLCDAWALPDYCLHSLLGRSDGQPYASLTAAAESEPINHLSPALGGYESVLKPLMNYERWRETGQYSKLNQYRVTSNPVIQGLSKL